ncbi:MAG: sodium:solute symporter family transporter [Fimbriiglobus sp.]
MPTLSTIDLVIVFIYIVGMTLFGLWFSKQQKDLKAYFVGDRNVGWFMVLVSIVATETSAVTFLSVPGTAYEIPGGNFTFLQLALGYIVGRCIVAWLLLPMYMRGELFSAYQVLQLKFGKNVQRVASALFMLTRTIADGLRLFLTALVVQYVGWGMETAIIAVGVITIIYTYMGGMKAVLWTDLIQFVIKIAGAALAGVFVLQMLPGGWEQFQETGLEAGKFAWYRVEWDPTQPFNLWAGIIGGAVFSMASHGADQMMVQRYFCAKSLRHAQVAVVLSGFFVFAQFILFLGIGVGLYVANVKGTFMGASSKDEVFGLFIVKRLPIGIVGILVAAILAAAMSTLSSSLNSSANAFVTDFYKPIRAGRDEKHYVLVSRIMTALWGVAQIAVGLVAYWSGSERSIVNQVLTVAGFTTGLILGLFLLGMLPRTVKPSSALIGLTAGFLTVTGVWVSSLFGTTVLAFPWFALVGSSTTVIVALASDYLSGGNGSSSKSANGSP